METLERLLTIDSNTKDFEERFKKIAKLLLNNYCINNGTYKYEIVEFEFYVINPNINKDDDIGIINKNVVYPRTGIKAGDLFYHYSGFDICFESKSNNCYGGILIRTIQNGNNYYGGPLVCKDEILNTATELPRIEPKKETNYDYDEPTKRVGINNNLKYRYFRKSENTIITRKLFKTNGFGEIIDTKDSSKYNWAQNPK